MDTRKNSDSSSSDLEKYWEFGFRKMPPQVYNTVLYTTVVYTAILCTAVVYSIVVFTIFLYITVLCAVYCSVLCTVVYCMDML